jgi:hypothetical protein
MQPTLPEAELRLAEEMNTLTFSITSDEADRWQIIPAIDALPLTSRAQAFEIENGWKPAGGYGGLVPSNYDFDPFDQYFLGTRQDTGLSPKGKIAVLGCSCGEVGCWPLLTRVRFDGEQVTWQDFEQPHRRERSYAGFGPFSFSKREYEIAIGDLIATMKTQSIATAES